MTQDPAANRVTVAVGQLWRRKNGVVYETQEMRVDGELAYFLLVPVVVPSGIKARRTWKYGALVEFDLTFVGDAPAKP